MYDLALARALHVLAVVVWIGGVSMVTAVLLPAIRRGELGADRLAGFQAIERRFVWHARAAVLLAGITGVYMVFRLDLWRAFREPHSWWLHAMLVVWTLFAAALFAVEPLARHCRLHGSGSAAPAKDIDTQLSQLQWVHLTLLAAALVTVLGAVAGSHGWTF